MSAASPTLVMCIYGVYVYSMFVHNQIYIACYNHITDRSYLGLTFLRMGILQSVYVYVHT